VLGPLRDLIGSVGPRLSRALEQGDRGEVLEALRAECEQAERPAVLVVEDVHWADEATLDVLRYLVRRVARWPLALVLTYRDDELGSDHRLRPLLGLIAEVDRVRRLRPARLTLPAVRRLTAAAEAGRGTRLDAAGVYAVTCGNPYFVAEVLATRAGHTIGPAKADHPCALLAAGSLCRSARWTATSRPCWRSWTAAPAGKAVARAAELGLGSAPEMT
jgi:hypothetical protein